MAAAETIKGYVSFDQEEYKSSFDHFSEQDGFLEIGSYNDFIESQQIESLPKAVQLARYLGAMSANRVRLARDKSTANPDDL
jgi:hypothetical protein